jgi:competence protein ComEC
VSWASNVAYTSVPARRHPALLVAVVVAAGIAAGDYVGWQPSTWAVFCVAGFLVILSLFRSQGRPTELARAVVILALLFAVGGLRLSVERHGRPAPVLMELASSNRPVEVFGHLAGVPQSVSSGWRAPFEVQGVRTRAGLVHINALVLLKAPEPMEGLRYGDHLRMTARFHAPRVRRNPGGFDYAKYLFYRGIDALAKPVGQITRVEGRNHRLSPYNLVEPAREWIRSTFTRYLSPTPRALILGFLLGDTDGLPLHVYQAVRNSGTLHLLAVSGANVWLIVGMALLPLRLVRVPRWPRTLMLLVLVTLFSYLTRN